jgi:hypothetical protein
VKALAILPAALALAACGGGARPEAAVARPIPFPTGSGLNAVIGKDAGALTALFGQPNADVREGAGRKLQYAGPICVLDAYLYPKGSGAPVVTWVDARQTDGSPIDKASCVGALQHRR